MFATWSTSLLFMIIIAATAAAVINDRTTGRFQRENAKSLPTFTKASLVVLVIKNLPAKGMYLMKVQPLSQEDALE